MTKRRPQIELLPSDYTETSRLCSANHVRWYVGGHPVWGHLNDAELGEKLGLSAGYVGMIMSGARPPTKKFLEAIGWEEITLYQMASPRALKTRRAA